MSDKAVNISIDRRRNAIAVLPTNGVSWGRIESTLIAAGMSPSVIRSARKIFLPVNELSNVRRALEKWQIELGPEVVAASDAASILQHSLLRARRAINDI